MESIAQELWEKSITYGDIASKALSEHISFEDAMIHIWLKLNVPSN